MPQTETLAQSVEIPNVQESWNQQRSVDHLRKFVLRKLDNNPEELVLI